MSNSDRQPVFTTPVFLAAAAFLFVLALLEKGLNLVGTSMPLVNVLPSQLLSWAVTLLVFDIALLLRQILETRL